MKNNKYDQISYCAKMIYEDKLISAGFVSYNNEGLSWYKVLNGCILQSVYLYSLFPRAPFLMAEGYGCHPLFIPAPIPQKVVFNEFWEDEIMQCALKGFQHSTYEGTQVLCRNTEERGAEVLDTDIFPIFRKINTEEDAYRLHKKECIEGSEACNRRNPGEPIQTIGSEWLADEAIYFNDTEIQQLMLGQLLRQKRSMENDKIASKARRLEWCKKQIEAIQSGEREPFLMMLEARKKRFIRDLEKKVGIRV